MQSKQDLARLAETVMSRGGDARIILDRETGLNRYLTAPRPCTALAFSSSTASHISSAAFDHVCEQLQAGERCYTSCLDGLRARIRKVYALPAATDIAFAASGTDLEYVALAACAGRASGGIHNILLGAHEVGSGCILSAHGRYYAENTPRGVETEPGMPVDGFGDVTLAEIPLRSEDGKPVSGSELVAAINAQIEWSRAQQKHALVHVVHGSKTGLIVPSMGDLQQLVQAHDGEATFVVDACQGRLGEGVAAAYCALGCVVLVTGSKFIGGPPFSGFALLPAGMAQASGPLPRGLANVFRRAEFPATWPGRDVLGEGANEGLALRLQAALFELERYAALDPDRRAAVIAAFRELVTRELLDPLRLKKVAGPEAGEGPFLPAETLVTIDLSPLAAGRTFERAAKMQRALLAKGIRLGQPVRCQRLPGGEWSGNLRVSLSMPQIVELAAMEPDEMTSTLSAQLRRVAEEIKALA